MEGVKYINNEAGERIAVQIDLIQYKEIWKEFCIYLEKLQASDYNKTKIEQKIAELEDKNKLQQIIKELTELDNLNKF